jgi:hypothetical protein
LVLDVAVLVGYSESGVCNKSTGDLLAVDEMALEATVGGAQRMMGAQAHCGGIVRQLRTSLQLQPHCERQEAHHYDQRSAITSMQ